MTVPPQLLPAGPAGRHKILKGPSSRKTRVNSNADRAHLTRSANF